MRYKLAAGACFGLMLILHAMPCEAAFHFSDPTTYKPASSLWSTAIADFDGDGRQDVTTAADGSSADRTLFVYFSKAGGGFDPVVKINGPFPAGGRPPIIAVDVDNDGHADIAIGHASGVALVHFDATRAITTTQASGPFSNLLSEGDVNGDGFQDVVSDTAVYYGDAQGNLGAGVALDLEGFPYPPVAIALADTNHDGRDDLVASDSVNAYVFRSEAGGFTSSPRVLSPGYHPWSIGGVVAADFNHDGRTDVAMSKASNSPTMVSVFYQDAAGGFSVRKDLENPDSPAGLQAKDVNGDGFVDLVVMHDGCCGVGVYFQAVAGLSEETLYPTVTSHLQSGMALGDVNGDGCTDIAAANPVAGLQLRYGQECGPPNLAVKVGLTASTATVRLENASGFGLIDRPVAELDLSIRIGSLQLTSMPGNCVAKSVSAAKVHIECLTDLIAAGQSQTFLVDFQASPRTIGNRITISANAQYSALESNPYDNSATKWINFWPALNK